MTPSRAALAALASSLALAGAVGVAVTTHQRHSRRPLSYWMQWLQAKGSELGLEFLQLALNKARLGESVGTPLFLWELVGHKIHSGMHFDWEAALSGTTLLQEFRFEGAGTFNAVFSNNSVALRIGVKQCRESGNTAGTWPTALPEMCTREMFSRLRGAADRACVHRFVEAGIGAHELAEGYLVFYQERGSPKCTFMAPGPNWVRAPPEIEHGSVLILPIAVMEFCGGGLGGCGGLGALFAKDLAR